MSKFIRNTIIRYIKNVKLLKFELLLCAMFDAIYERIFNSGFAYDWIGCLILDFIGKVTLKCKTNDCVNILVKVNQVIAQRDDEREVARKTENLLKYGMKVDILPVDRV